MDSLLLRRALIYSSCSLCCWSCQCRKHSSNQIYIFAHTEHILTPLICSFKIELFEQKVDDTTPETRGTWVFWHLAVINDTGISARSKYGMEFSASLRRLRHLQSPHRTHTFTPSHVTNHTLLQIALKVLCTFDDALRQTQVKTRGNSVKNSFSQNYGWRCFLLSSHLVY